MPRYKLRVAPVFALWTLLGCREAVSQAVIPEAPACARCAIISRPVATIGDEEGPGALERQPRTVNVDRRGFYYVWAATLPQVYDPSGRFVGTIGRVGSGPGELRGPAYPVPIPGDSVLVLEPGSGRGSIFGPDLSFKRVVRLGAAVADASVVHWPDTVALFGMISSRERFGLPLHIASLAANEGRILRSGGLGSGEQYVTGERVLLANQGRPDFWVYREPLRLTAWDVSLRAMRTLERKPEWWTNSPPERRLGVPHVTPPDPHVTAVTVDSTGLLWVYIAVPAKNWRAGWSAVPRGAVEVRESQIEFSKLYDTSVEVIDPAAARVVTRTTLTGYVIDATARGMAMVFAPRDDGLVCVSVMQLQLTR